MQDPNYPEGVSAQDIDSIGEQLMAEPCPNCKEEIEECACMRNRCMRCGKPVGNITFTVCDECWEMGVL